jgi:hypothetical protein
MDGRRNRKERQWSSQRLLVLFNLTLIYPKKSGEIEKKDNGPVKDYWFYLISP